VNFAGRHRLVESHDAALTEQTLPALTQTVSRTCREAVTQQRAGGFEVETRHNGVPAE
jgi:hypothetical protein